MFASYTQLYALQHQIRRKGKAFLWNLQIFCHKIMLFSTFLAFFSTNRHTLQPNHNILSLKLHTKQQNEKTHILIFYKKSSCYDITTGT